MKCKAAHWHCITECGLISIVYHQLNIHYRPQYGFNQSYTNAIIICLYGLSALANDSLELRGETVGGMNRAGEYTGLKVGAVNITSEDADELLFLVSKTSISEVHRRDLG